MKLIFRKRPEFPRVMDNINYDFLSEKHQNEWDQYVFKSHGTSFVHHSAWKDLISEVYGHRSYYLIARNQNKIVGVLPLFLISIPFLGKVLASGIFGSYGGICADSNEIAESLFMKARDLADSLDVKYLEIKNFNNYKLENETWKKYFNYYTLVINLDKNPDVVWHNISKKARQNIRKAINSNITIVKGDEYLDDFFELIAYNMKLLGTPVHSKKFYELILKKFKDKTNLYIARYKNKTVSAALTINCGQYIFGYANAAHPDFLSYKPNFLIYWEIIKSAEGSELKYFDLGRSLINSGTYNFKQNFGANPVPLYYDYYLNKIKDIPVINQDNSKLKFITKTWSHLPLSVTKIIGPQLIKYVA